MIYEWLTQRWLEADSSLKSVLTIPSFWRNSFWSGIIMDFSLEGQRWLTWSCFRKNSRHKALRIWKISGIQGCSFVVRHGLGLILLSLPEGIPEVNAGGSDIIEVETRRDFAVVDRHCLSDCAFHHSCKRLHLFGPWCSKWVNGFWVPLSTVLLDCGSCYVFDRIRTTPIINNAFSSLFHVK